ncbi:neutral zinc metallopeptidase [Spongiactinospora sp. TRM90649]|uniref:neutral zinc metallopeptidase n=1 Tax=Spongiactinospora sp. TRM90649 TaxID=3031114 RepID=UPI0023F783DE|nr:neutral zinc metallopeptidase [Spongiactinospora sp. TRM90649]MDF5751730.1 neutral zinc metallopeptidase [Spongiactinospora sp. TRM90649]
MLGSVGLLTATVAAVVVAAALTGGDEAISPADAGSGPRATTTADVVPDDAPAEIGPPSVAPLTRLPKTGSEAPRAKSPDSGRGTAAGTTDSSAPNPPSGVTVSSVLNRPAGQGAVVDASRMLVDLRRMRRSDTRARLTRNPLYGTGVMRPMACRAPRPSTRPADMRRFLDAATGCLDRAWAGKFAQARALFMPPRRVFYSGSGRGPCGVYPASGTSAYYCPSNRGMYIGLRHVVQASGGANPAANPTIYLRVLAHEYGHHAQSMSGIGGAWWWEVSSRSRSAQDAHTRRSELQAQCFAGTFARSARRTLGITSGQWTETLRDSLTRGDDRRGGRDDHGTGDRYVAWLHQGWRYGRIAYCNTWAVAASQVR